jgi:hypothetical protein
MLLPLYMTTEINLVIWKWHVVTAINITIMLASKEKQIHHYLAKWCISGEPPPIKLQASHVKAHQPVQQDQTHVV